MKKRKQCRKTKSAKVEEKGIRSETNRFYGGKREVSKSGGEVITVEERGISQGGGKIGLCRN